MVGVESAAFLDEFFKGGDIVIVEIVRGFAADDDIAGQHGSDVADGLRHVAKPSVKPLPVLLFTLFKYAEEAG